MSNTSEIKQANLLAIIKIIRNNGPISKPEIAKLSNLTFVTVHNYIAELVESKLIIKQGNAESNGGRKAILYRINPRYGYVISQNLGIGYIRTSIYDMDLNLLYGNTCYLNMEYSDKIISIMCQEIEAGMKNQSICKEDCIGIGISVPGQVDHDNGVIINLTNVHGWKRIPIKTIMEKAFAIPTFIDNDINSTALAVKWMNIIKENVDAVFVNITNGLGLGIIIKGKLFYGSHSSVGELGHTTVQYDGPKCNCGNNGCLETLVSDTAIIERYRNEAGLPPNGQALDLQSIIDMAKHGDDIAFNIFKETSKFIIITIDHIIKLYGPDVIVIECKWLKEFQELFFYVTDKVFSGCAWIRREDVNIMLNPVENIIYVGAATLVFENIFNSSSENFILKKYNL